MTDKTPLSAGDSPDYIDSLLAYLGDQEPLDVFSRTPAALRAATVGLTNAQLTTPEAPGKWSVLNIVQHLGQAEIALGFRYRKVLAEDGPSLPAIEQDPWVEGLFPDEVDLEEALENFESVRLVNLRLLRRVSGDQWARHGMHTQRGRETLAHMVRLYAAHDAYHLYQIDRVVKSLEGV